jgi:uroporphyrinogen decarboxylase
MAARIPNIDRLLKTFRYEKTPDVPNLELSIESRAVEHFVGQRKRMGVLEPEARVRLSEATGQDAIIVATTHELGEIREVEPDGFSFYKDGTIKTQADLDTYDLPALLHQWSVETDTLLARHTAALRGNLGLAVYIPGPLYEAYLSVGLADFMVKVADDPDLLLHLMDFHTEWGCESAKLAVKHGAAFAILGDDLAHTTGMLVSPRLIADWWMPRTRKIVQILDTAGIPCMVHSCGKLDKVLPFLIELGVDVVNPFQPQCNDIYAVRHQYGQKIALMGNIDITFPLSMGTPDDVRQDVREHLERLAPGGGYIVASGHSIINSIPPENYVAMLETVWEWRNP